MFKIIVGRTHANGMYGKNLIKDGRGTIKEILSTAFFELLSKDYI